MKQMKIFCALMALVLVFTGCAAGQKQKPESQKSGHDNLYFTAKDTEIALNAPAQPVLDALGGSFGMTEAQGCATTDMVRTYDYRSFFLQAAQGEKGYYICGAWFTDETVSTPEGIHIGSTTQEVEEAYGTVEDISCGGDTKYGSCLVQKGEGQLYIYLEDDVVRSIQYILGGC